MKQLQRLTALLLAVCVCFAGCGGKADEGRATTMRLEKTEGTVSVLDAEKTFIHLQENLPLYNGYSIQTDTASYGWIGLDDTKLAKLNEASTAFVQKDGRDLLLTVNTGDLFFEVTKPLEADETMTIRTSTLIVGIRGTCGWIQGSSTVYILEGTVTCEFPEEGLSTQVSAGEMAYLVRGTESRIEVSPFSRADIPDFVLAEVDEATVNAIPEAAEAVPEEPSAPETEKQEDNVYTLPLSADEFRNLAGKRSDEPVIIRAGAADSTLVVDRFTSVYGHLILEEGVSLTVAEHTQINIEGTLEIHSDLVNDGFIWILEDGTLQVDGAFTNTGMLVNGEVDKGMDEEPVETQNCRIIAAQGIVSTGSLDNAGTIEGTVTVNGGNISLMAGTVDKLILNDGLYIDDGGACGEFVQNGGKTTSAAQGYYY